MPHFLFSWCPSVCLFRTFLLQTVLSLSIPSQPSPIWDQCTPRLSLRWPSARTHICVCLLSVFRGPLNSALAGPDTLTSPLRPTEWRKVIRFPYPCQTHIHRHASVEVACPCEWSSLLSLPNIKAWNQTKFPQQPLGLWDGLEANMSGHWPDSVPTSWKSGAGLGCRGAPLKNWVCYNCAFCWPMGETQVCRTDALNTALPNLKIFTVLLVYSNVCLHSEFERQRNDKKNMQTALNAFIEHIIDVFSRNKQCDLLW